MNQSDAEQITIITPEKDLDHQTMADATMSLQRMMQALLRKTSEKHHPSVLKDVNTIMSVLLEVERVSEETARQNRALLEMLKEAIFQRDVTARALSEERTANDERMMEIAAEKLAFAFGFDRDQAWEIMAAVVGDSVVIPAYLIDDLSDVFAEIAAEVEHLENEE